MAKFKLLDFIDVGTQGYHDATSWRITKDAAGKHVIDQSLNDKVNLYVWDSPLPDGNGGYYADLNTIYLWVKVHILGSVSDWLRLPPVNQNNQQFIITENGLVVNTVNSITTGIQ